MLERLIFSALRCHVPRADNKLRKAHCKHLRLAQNRCWIAFLFCALLKLAAVFLWNLLCNSTLDEKVEAIFNKQKLALVSWLVFNSSQLK
jgi:hypothetical protein